MLASSPGRPASRVTCLTGARVAIAFYCAFALLRRYCSATVFWEMGRWIRACFHSEGARSASRRTREPTTLRSYFGVALELYFCRNERNLSISRLYRTAVYSSCSSRTPSRDSRHSFVSRHPGPRLIFAYTFTLQPLHRAHVASISSSSTDSRLLPSLARRDVSFSTRFRFQYRRYLYGIYRRARRLYAASGPLESGACACVCSESCSLRQRGV
jgi:hypothetical protein